MRIVIVFFTLLVWQITVKAQGFSELTIGLGSGYPSILKLDEIIDDDVIFQYERDALPPINFWAETNINHRLVTGLYIGYEEEKGSGTIVGFAGTNRVLVIGAPVYYYFNKHRFASYEKFTVSPFAGLLMAYSDADTSEPIKGFTVTPALGADFLFHKNWLSRVKVGFGSALIELSFAYRIKLKKGE